MGLVKRMGWWAGSNHGGWGPYVSQAERRREAEKAVAKMTRKGEKVDPVVIKGRTIASTFWGMAWCKSLESYMDYANRLPRGRTYVRNGSVVNLHISRGKITSLVSGSSLYKVKIEIKPLAASLWQRVIKECTGKVDSLVELLQGKLSQSVMETVTSREFGLFPSPKQIKMQCSCPDWASMCKHIAATLYGVGHRLDQEPELLFRLRQVDHLDLLSKAHRPAALTGRGGEEKRLEARDLGSMFGIEMEIGPSVPDDKVGKNKVLKKKVSKKKILKKKVLKKKVLKKKVLKKKVLKKKALKPKRSQSPKTFLITKKTRAKPTPFSSRTTSPKKLVRVKKKVSRVRA